MPFQNNEEEIYLKLSAIAESHLKKNASRIDNEYLWPHENIEAIKDAGLGGLLVSKDLGGMGHGLLTMVKSCEILGAACASTSMCYGMHLVGSVVISAKATEFHKEAFLKPIAEGKHWTTLSLSEPGTGSLFYIPQTQIVEDDECLILNGKKSFVTNGGHADSYVMNAVHSTQGTTEGRFSCIVLPKNTSGLKWGNDWRGMGMRGNSSKSAELNDVRIPKKNLLGEAGDQIWYVFEVVTPTFLLAMSGTYLGIANAALNETINHVKARTHTHTGNTLASMQLVQHRVGLLWAEVEKTRQLVYSAAAMFDDGDPAAILSVMSAKAEVGDCVVSVVNEAMTLMGGEAYGYTGDMERHLRDARAAHVMAPTTDILRVWTGRALLGQPLLGE